MSKTSSNIKKNLPKRTAMRDIAIKRPQEEAFTVQPIETALAPSFDEFDDAQVTDRSEPNDRFQDVGFDQPLGTTDDDDLISEPEPKEVVRVKFAKFVQLVANHNFDDVVKNNPEEEVILSSNLLTELAGAHDERGERKIPIIFLVGLTIGIVLTYILLK